MLLTMWLHCGKPVIQKILNARPWASYRPYHGLKLPNCRITVAIHIWEKNSAHTTYEYLFSMTQILYYLPFFMETHWWQVYCAVSMFFSLLLARTSCWINSPIAKIGYAIMIKSCYSQPQVKLLISERSYCFVYFDVQLSEVGHSCRAKWYPPCKWGCSLIQNLWYWSASPYTHLRSWLFATLMSCQRMSDNLTPQIKLWCMHDVIGSILALT